jgi:erythromycin esterase
VDGRAIVSVLAGLAACWGARIRTPASSEPEVARWLAASALAIERAEPGRGTADLAAAGTWIGSARIVGLGEASHGTHEFFQLKHRFFEYAVAELGFTVFAIEAGATECRDIDDYIATGHGDPRAVLRTIPIWNTEEVLALIEWMRGWNADPAHHRKLRFAGIDMQTPYFAFRSVTAFLAQVAPERGASLDSLAVLGGDTGQLDPLRWAALARELAALAALFDANRDRWSERARAPAYENARHDVTLMTQAAQVYGLAGADPERAEELRDRFMADNAEWLLAHEPAGARMVLWAHNGHIALRRSERFPMGGELHRRLGADYVSIGFVFGQGELRVPELRRGRAVLASHQLGPAPAADVSTPFAAAGKPLAFASLRDLPDGAVADWFWTPHPMREVGGVWEPDPSRWAILPSEFDAVIYVDRTTGSHPLP